MNPLAREWNDEKNTSIDWTNPDEILANHFTFLQILEAHTKLNQFFKKNTEEKEKIKQIFLDCDSRAEKIKLLKEWNQKQLFTLRQERWCRYCGNSGHSKLQCEKLKTEEKTQAAAMVLNPNDNGLSNSDAGLEKASNNMQRIQERFKEHQRRIEQVRMLEEKARKKQSGAQSKKNLLRAKKESYAARQNRGPSDAAASPNTNTDEINLFTDERRVGVILSIDLEFNSGSVRVTDVGDIRYYVDRVDYGVKKISVGDTVTLRVDQSRDFPLAVDVRPAKSTVSAEDVSSFLIRCKNAPRPIEVICMLLTHKHEWFDVVQYVQLYRDQSEIEKYMSAVYSLVELTTFFENREPIHYKMLEAFLNLMCSTSASVSGGRRAANNAASSSPEVPFFPSMVLDVVSLSKAKTLGSNSEELEVHISNCIEVADFIILVRQFTSIPEESCTPCYNLVEEILKECDEKYPSFHSVIKGALHRLSRASISRQEEFIIPSAEEFNHPPPDPKSSFSYSNLPINGKTYYNNVENFALDHCKLLRADTFEAISRILPCSCLQLKNCTYTENTKSDVEHCHLYHNVQFMGSVITPDRDYSLPKTFLLYVEEKSPRADFFHQLHQGSTVVIVTTLTPDHLTDDEIFWGVVSSANAEFLRSGIICVSQCEYSSSFDLLAANLQRNAREGKASHSLLLETAIFMTGYTGVTKSLYAFVGPMAMGIPMADKLIPSDPKAVVKTNDDAVAQREKKLIGCIPPHCKDAFHSIVQKLRLQHKFDSGQDEVLKRLSSSDVLLVQGPPGTGKSFVGCRVVETYVRFKQQLESGDILQRVNIDLLSHVKPEELLPKMGPIVVITFKNHALDEFLVDLLESDLWTAQQRISNTGKEQFPGGRKLIRVGARSLEDRLDPHNLSSLLRGRADKSGIDSLKDRIFTLHKRLDRLTKEIQFLEAGKVPQVYFQRWLTSEQSSSIAFKDREEWLSGKQYVGEYSGQLPPSNYYLQLLQPNIAQRLAAASSAEQKQNVANIIQLAQQLEDEAEENEDVKKSVFQEMKKDSEYREMNRNLNSTYLSAEAMHLASHPPSLPSQVPQNLQSLWSLDPMVRHHYYAYLIQKTIASKAKDSLTIMATIQDLIKIRDHASDEAKLSILREADVIGLTTTGCALNQNLLRSLQPSVLVVEEAAEVLESQLVACLTDSLKQIVLIGDHFQLQPKTETYEYQKYNHLNLSLFERLSTQFKPICLSEQRRMHPELSTLVRPYYYPQPLIDHPSLLTRPFITSSAGMVTDAVPGLASRVFFWRHNYPEEDAPRSRSKINSREILMVQRTVEHLISQGVMQSSITVITPYLGQCRELKGVIRLSSFSDVRVSTVDLFQGDENDIIILSLVRTAKLTDFIRTRNRLIVSCSRARFAFVIMGSDKLLRECEHWAQLLQQLEEKNRIGDRLPITFRDEPGKIEYLEVHETLTDEALNDEMQKKIIKEESGRVGETAIVNEEN